MKRLLWIALFLLWANPAHAFEKYQNWCQQGGQQVSLSGTRSTTRVQQTFPVCTITVYSSGTSNLATLYSDNAGASLGNPFTNQNQSTGQFFFFVASGYYDIQIQATGLTTYTLTNVGLGGTGGTKINCANYPGSNIGTKMSNAYINVSSTGGIIDCSGVLGAQAITADPFTSMSNPVTVIPSIGTISSSSSMTVPSNVTLELPQGAIFCPAVGTTITIQGTISGSSSLSTHFSTACAGKVIISSTKVPYIYPQWWGAVGDGTTNDYAAVQAAEDAAIGAAALNTLERAPVGVVYFLPGTYYITQSISTCHYNGCPGGGPGGGGTTPAGAINACVSLKGTHRGQSTLFTDQAIDMIQMYSWACPSAVEDLMIVSSATSVGIRVRGNQTSIRRNWMLVDHGIVIESTGTIDTGFTTLEDNLCDATQIGGGPGCIIITETGGGTGRPSPNYISITNQMCFGGAWCVQSDKIYDSRINGLTHDGPGTYAISLTNAANVAISNVNATGANVNQDPNEHGLEIIDSSNVLVSNLLLRTFPASAVFVSNSTGVTISDFAFTDNVQTVGPVNPYEVTLLRSDVVLKGGSITNNTGHATRAILFSGVGDGNYVVDDVIIRGNVMSSTVIEGSTGAGGILSAKLNNIYIDSTWVSDPQILMGAVIGLNVTNMTMHGGAATTWLSSTYVFTNQCFSGNIVDGGNILLNSVPFTGYTTGCFNGATQLSDGQFGAVNVTSRITAPQMWITGGTRPIGNGYVSLGTSTVGTLGAAAGHEGQMIFVTDSTVIASEGQACAGSGTVHALAVSNGTIWKCF